MQALWEVLDALNLQSPLSLGVRVDLLARKEYRLQRYAFQTHE